MDINDILKTTQTTLPAMISEIVETQCALKAMLVIIISELANNDPEKEQQLIDEVNIYREQELLRVIGRFVSQRKDK